MQLFKSVVDQSSQIALASKSKCKILFANCILSLSFFSFVKKRLYKASKTKQSEWRYVQVRWGSVFASLFTRLTFHRSSTLTELVSGKRSFVHSYANVSLCVRVTKRTRNECMYHACTKLANYLHLCCAVYFADEFLVTHGINVWWMFFSKLRASFGYIWNRLKKTFSTCCVKRPRHPLCKKKVSVFFCEKKWFQ